MIPSAMQSLQDKNKMLESELRKSKSRIEAYRNAVTAFKLKAASAAELSEKSTAKCDSYMEEINVLRTTIANLRNSKNKSRLRSSLVGQTATIDDIDWSKTTQGFVSKYNIPRNIYDTGSSSDKHSNNISMIQTHASQGPFRRVISLVKKFDEIRGQQLQEITPAIHNPNTNPNSNPNTNPNSDRHISNDTAATRESWITVIKELESLTESLVDELCCIHLPDTQNTETMSVLSQLSDIVVYEFFSSIQLLCSRHPDGWCWVYNKLIVSRIWPAIQGRRREWIRYYNQCNTENVNLNLNLNWKFSTFAVLLLGHLGSIQAKSQQWEYDETIFGLQHRLYQLTSIECESETTPIVVRQAASKAMSMLRYMEGTSQIGNSLGEVSTNLTNSKYIR